MSILYKLTGKPRTVNDLADEAKKDGYQEVNIDIREKNKDGCFRYYEVYLQIGETEKMLSRHYPFVTEQGTEGIPKMYAEVKALMWAAITATIMKDEGLIARINGEPMDDLIEKRVKEIEPMVKPLTKVIEDLVE